MKRAPGKIVHLKGGPWNGQSARLSGDALNATAVFNVREWRGRYVNGRWENVA